MAITNLRISKQGAVNISVIKRQAFDLYHLVMSEVTYDMDAEIISFTIDITSQADLQNITSLIASHYEAAQYSKADEIYKEDLYSASGRLESTAFYSHKDSADVMSGKVRDQVYVYSSLGLMTGIYETIFDKSGNIISKELEEYFQEKLPNGKTRRVTKVTEL